MPARPVFDRPIAHRGLHDRARGVIENSRSAFEAAITAGHAIECDLQLSRDGVPVIFHDDDLERLTGIAGPVGNLTAAELTSTPLLGSTNRDCPQLLGDFLAQVDGRTMIQLELKRQPTRLMAEMLARTAAEALAAYAGPVTVESFDPRLLVLMRRNGCHRLLGIITYGYDKPEWDEDVSASQRVVLRNLLHWPWTRFGFISCYIGSLDLPAVRLFRALGMPVTAWTVRTPEDVVRAAAGADQIVFEGFDPSRA